MSFCISTSRNLVEKKLKIVVEMSFYSLAVVRRKQSKQTSLNLKKKPLLLAKMQMLSEKNKTLKKLLRAAEGLRHRRSVRSYETLLISSQSFILIIYLCFYRLSLSCLKCCNSSDTVRALWVEIHRAFTKGNRASFISYEAMHVFFF